MPATLKRTNDCYALSLSGLEDAVFKEKRDLARGIKGRRWNPDGKVWEFPDDLETLLEVVHTIQPELSAEVRETVQSAQGLIADDLVTKLPEDAELTVPWAPRLFPFQRSGVAFMLDHPHTILADEMGLGKTVEAITVIEEALQAELRPPALVICPNMVRGVWESTLKYGPRDEEGNPLWPEWPGFESATIDGDKGKRERQLAEALHGGVPYVIINWEKVRLLPELAKVNWSAVVADEAHRAKNWRAKQSKALHKIRADIEIAATGTPIMNQPGELWSLLHWLRPEQYTSYWAFDAQYVEGYKGYKGKKVITGVRNPDSLRFELADKLVRRTKVQVKEQIGYVGKLPPVIQEVDLYPKQRRAYEAAEEDVWLDVKAAMEDPDLAEAKKQDIVKAMTEGDDRTLAILIPNAAARIVRLRQIATSPAIVPVGEGEPAAEDVSATLDAAQERIMDSRSGEEYEPFVVFTWYKDSAELLAKRLRKLKPTCRAETLHGDVPQDARQAVVDDFQNGEIDVLVMTIMTGGAGITLTRANKVIFVEEDWVPGNNNQAIDRVDRIGQKSLVTIYKVRARDTVHTKRIAPTNRIKELMSGAVLGYGQEAVVQ